MNIKKEYMILAAIIVILSVYLLKHQKGKMHYSLPELGKIDKKDITKLIIRKVNSEITMLKKNDKWVITPQNFPVNNDMAGKMEDELVSLSVTDLVSEAKNDIIYDLNKEKKIEVEAYKGDQAIRRIEIGKPASSYRHTFIRIEKDDRIYHARGNLTNTFDKTISGLRDKTVLAFKSEEITEISLTKGNKKLKVVRSSAPGAIDLNKEKNEKRQELSPKWSTDNGGPVNEAEIEDVIKVLSNLTCDDFAEGKIKNDFKNAIFTVSLKGIKEYSISIFTKSDNRYSAVSSETEYPFYISEWNTERFMKDPETLKEDKK